MYRDPPLQTGRLSLCSAADCAKHIEYFVIYTAPAIIRTMNEFSGNGFDVLFLGARMRAIQLSQGETENYELPQPWAQRAMYWATYAVLAQVLLVIAV